MKFLPCLLNIYAQILAKDVKIHLNDNTNLYNEWRKGETGRKIKKE